MVENVKSLLRKIKRQIDFNIHGNGYKREVNTQKAIILMGDPEYENLGDHAIAYATKAFIERTCSGYTFVSVPEKYIKYSFFSVKREVEDSDVLLLQGGGNMGDLYPDQVEIRKKVILAFPKNKIVIMPQTIYFSNGICQLPEYYADHKNLILVAREQTSYGIMQNLYGGRVLLTPDIVFSLLENMNLKADVERNNALICIRDDIESANNADEIKDFVEEQMRKVSLQIEYISMVLDRPITIAERNDELEKLFEKFQNAKIVVTDRLHGMIIAAITKTPCVVLPTFNHKVTSCYEWIKNLNYIRLCDTPDKFEMNLKSVMCLSESQKTVLKLDDKFDVLKEAILEED